MLLANHRLRTLIFLFSAGCSTGVWGRAMAGWKNVNDVQEAGAGATSVVDADEKRRVVESAIENLERYYVDAAAAKETAEALRKHLLSGDDDAATDGPAFAALITRQMREASNDKHLELAYSRSAIPEHPPQRTGADRARFRQEMERQNCTFEKVEILPPSIGYVKFNFFPDPSACAKIASGAMTRVNNAAALILDLRENRGGEPAMVALIAAYLFDHPEYWYSPRENTTADSWTRSPVAGNKLADKPVYVLTSSITLSGAEQFCYDLKMLKRATLVGETTGGAAHSGVFHRIDEHFGIGIREVNPINPYGQPDWEGTGVEPDVKVSADAALDRALGLARERLHR